MTKAKKAKAFVKGVLTRGTLGIPLFLAAVFCGVVPVVYFARWLLTFKIFFTIALCIFLFWISAIVVYGVFTFVRAVILDGIAEIKLQEWREKYEKEEAERETTKQNNSRA